MENAFHFLHFRNAKWNFLVDALNVYRLCCQASSWFYPGLLILFKSYLTVAKSYLFHVFLPFLYSLLFPLVDMCSMSTSALCCHAHALILKHWSTPHLFLTSGIVFFCCVSVLELVCMCVGDQARWKESLVEIHQRFSSLYEGRWAESQRPVNGVCVCLWVCVCVCSSLWWTGLWLKCPINSAVLYNHLHSMRPTLQQHPRHTRIQVTEKNQINAGKQRIWIHGWYEVSWLV